MKQVIIKMDDDTHKKLRLLCTEYQITMKRFIENAINADYATGEFIKKVTNYLDTTDKDEVEKATRP